MKRPALFLPALALALGLVTAGCGGEDRLSSEEFVKQADQLCADASEDLQAVFEDLSDAPTDDDIASFVTDTLVPNLQEQHDAIEDLNPPEDDQDAVDDMLAALQESIDALEDDPMLITSGTNPFDDANAAAQEVGLAKCGAN